MLSGRLLFKVSGNRIVENEVRSPQVPNIKNGKDFHPLSPLVNLIFIKN